MPKRARKQRSVPVATRRKPKKRPIRLGPSRPQHTTTLKHHAARVTTIRHLPVPSLIPEATPTFGWARFLVAAVILHAALLLVFTSIKLIVAVPVITAIFDVSPAPPTTAASDNDLDPFTALRHYEYAGGGHGGEQLPPTAYKAAILSPGARQASETVGKIIGIDVGNAFDARPEGTPLGLGSPLPGDGTSRYGTGIGGETGFGQRSPSGRAQAIRLHKGAGRADQSVVAALRWLKEQQDADGGWSRTKHRAGISALAVLAFLGHGETPDSEEFGGTLTRAFRFLTGSFNPNANMYEQAIVTYALAEGYGMTRSPDLREPLEQHIAVLLRAQKAPKTNPLHTGGWRYSVLSDDSDVSVTGWCVQALEAAKLAGVEIPQAALDDASRFLWNMCQDATFGYDRPGGSSGTSAIGILSEMLLGHSNDPRVKDALDKLKSSSFEWDKTEAPIGMVVYQWYYLTQTFFHAGGAYWQNWNDHFREALIQRQSDDGHWDLPAMSREKEFNQPPVYSTALCALMLEVYWRYLPTYRLAESRRLQK